MILTTEAVATQDITFIPRYDDIDSIVITNEATNESVVYPITTELTPYTNYLTASLVFSLLEGHYYNLEAFQATTGLLSYRGKIFCTDQTVDNSANYSYSTSKLKTHATENKYKIYE